MIQKISVLAVLLVSSLAWASGPDNNASGAGVGALGAKSDDSCLCNLHPGGLIEEKKNDWSSLENNGSATTTPATTPAGTQ